MRIPTPCLAALALLAAVGGASAQGPAALDSSLVELLRGTGNSPGTPLWIEVAKLLTSGSVGIIVTLFYKQYQRDRPPSRSIMQAQVLLCISGALMMIIIGNSTARALGIAGGASIIRFRTPVDDPRDAMMMFLLMGLGMSVGLGSFGVCALGTVFLCGTLAVLDRIGDRRPKQLFLDVVATGRDFPSEHVFKVLSAEVDSFEQVKVSQGVEASVRYLIKVNPIASISYISSRLMDDGKAGIKSVAWEQPKKSATTVVD